MIYDCFVFYNELELLELRLHELDEIVDRFVLVEAVRTYTNQPKPLYYQENRARFSAFQGRIIQIVVEDVPPSPDPWAHEYHQRNCISRGLTKCRPDDWILVSDVDEIPRAEAVARAASEFKFPRGFWADHFMRPVLKTFGAWDFSRGRVQRNHPYVFKFEQTLHRHFINCVTVAPPELVHWYGTRMLHYRDFTSAQFVRHAGYKIIENGGWHFTSMGGAGRIVQKIQSFAHQEFNRPEFLNAQRINEAINSSKSLFNSSEKLKFMPLDGSYPKYVLENPGRFNGWIKGV